MPYIQEKQKEQLDRDMIPENPGELTYVLQRAIKRYLMAQGPLRYRHIAEVLGSLEGAKLDFIERVVKPYEQSKCEANGDVWPKQLTSP